MDWLVCSHLRRKAAKLQTLVKRVFCLCIIHYGRFLCEMRRKQTRSTDPLGGGLGCRCGCFKELLSVLARIHHCPAPTRNNFLRWCLQAAIYALQIWCPCDVSENKIKSRTRKKSGVSKSEQYNILNIITYFVKPICFFGTYERIQCRWIGFIVIQTFECSNTAQRKSCEPSLGKSKGPVTTENIHRDPTKWHSSRGAFRVMAILCR